ncbi:hypothetical protein BEWA_011060 [Theileria equi strain WA]|uniref:Uncharacterized protein n=1 Tax=Theileria equi strain WA TaxID=1537102 RepID=L0B2G6_THEEQ|nr:hypothetical protein BEWA_011060 [Theileria equi strain WA]AFZ81688.1 hypothetical protein BEWA_011060 [Theileria equi strain WA]|eukprot:XP_004831354.1 hypothetical protein BEWA_011060 [Theileria equi strain WA]
MLPNEINTLGRGGTRPSGRIMVPFFDESSANFCFPFPCDKPKTPKPQKSPGKEINDKNKKANTSKFSGREIVSEKITQMSCNIKSNNWGKKQSGKKSNLKELSDELRVRGNSLNGSTSRGSQDDLFSDSLSFNSDSRCPRFSDVLGHGPEGDFRLPNRTYSSLSSDHEPQYSFASALIKSSNINENLRKLSVSSEGKSVVSICDRRSKELKLLLKQMGILSPDDTESKLKDNRVKEKIDTNAEKRYVFPKYMSSPDPSSIPVPGLP